MEVYYEQFQKLALGLQIPTIDSFLTTVFKAGLQSYLKIVIAGMKRSTLQQHKEAAMLFEEGITIIEAKSVISIPQNTKQVTPPKTWSNTRKIEKYYTNDGIINHNVETCRKKKKIP